MKLKKTLWLSIACLLCLWASQAQAVSITIFNTGVDATGTVLLNGTVGDPHYTLTSVPLGSSMDTLVRTSAGGYPIPPYIGDNTLSSWIGPNNDSDLDSPSGTYRYETTFVLPVLFDPTTHTAQLTGGWVTDNEGLNIYINGAPLGFTTGATSYTGPFSPFTVNSGFIAGTNTLAFVVNNEAIGANPTALRVEVTGEFSVPEPASLLLLGSGFVALAAWRRKYAA
jgi:hypothetical protein